MHYKKIPYVLDVYGSSINFSELKQFFFHLVGITWDDAPTEQHAVINTDYKIRCVVLASPPATIDWLKESLIVSTGRSSYFFCLNKKADIAGIYNTIFSLFFCTAAIFLHSFFYYYWWALVGIKWLKYPYLYKKG